MSPPLPPLHSLFPRLHVHDYTPVNETESAMNFTAHGHRNITDAERRAHKLKVDAIIGTLGFGMLAIIIGSVIWICWRERQRRRKTEEGIKMKRINRAVNAAEAENEAEQNQTEPTSGGLFASRVSDSGVCLLVLKLM
ncbi:hypothetical protein K440DRAFT_637461 [Wilcoxina mikolae CBS 423.85]|nr:hypothetical protein K440DRAFT_637461 [Wilcoxina mikolae CBS 423.85]